MMSDNSQAESFNETVTLMIGYLCIKDLENLTEQVSILDRFDLTDAQKAQICGAKTQSVRNARLKIKK